MSVTTKSLQAAKKVYGRPLTSKVGGGRQYQSETSKMDLSLDSLSQDQIDLIQKVTNKLKEGDAMQQRVNQILQTTQDTNKSSWKVKDSQTAVNKWRAGTSGLYASAKAGSRLNQSVNYGESVKSRVGRTAVHQNFEVGFKQRYFNNSFLSRHSSKSPESIGRGYSVSPSGNRIYNGRETVENKYGLVHCFVDVPQDCNEEE